MSARADTEGTSGLDKLKMLVALAILGAGIAGFYLFPEQSQLVRVIGVVVAAVLAWLVYAQTESGRDAIEFIAGSRQELRKMHWPTRAETVQTTLVVLVMVLILGIFLWLLDMFLLWAVQLLTGQGS